MRRRSLFLLVQAMALGVVACDGWPRSVVIYKADYGASVGDGGAAFQSGGSGGSAGPDGIVASGGAMAEGSGGLSASGGADAESSGGVSASGGAFAEGSSGAPSSGGAAAAVECSGTFESSDPTAGLGIGELAYTSFDFEGACIGGNNPEPGKVCLAGTIPAHNGDYLRWGAGLGIDFSSPLVPVDISAHQGFRFALEGSLPPEFRIGVRLFIYSELDPQSFFTTNVALGENVIAFDDLAQGSWVSGTADEMEWDPTHGAKLWFQIPPNRDTEVTFDFCISGVEWVDEPIPSGD